MQGINSFSEVIRFYFAGNILLVLAVIGLAYWLMKSNKEIRKWAAVLLIGILFIYNGISYRVICLVGESDTYYRLLWILPVTLFGAYMVIELWHMLEERKKIIYALFLVCVFGVTCVFPVDGWIKIPENVYQISNDAVGIADIIDEHSGGARVAVWEDGSIRGSIREYNDNICWPMGDRERLDYSLISQEPEFTAEEIKQYVKQAETDYIILRKDKATAIGWIEEIGYPLIGQTANYNVYYVERTTE